ncbi:MAG: nucleotidyltransferase family protein [Pseudomonadota bacterium]
MLKEQFSTLQTALHRACLDYYGERLVSLAVFGSVARGTMRPDSDIDCLIVAAPLPRGRMARMREFAAIKTAMDDALRAAGRRGVQPPSPRCPKPPAKYGREVCSFSTWSKKPVSCMIGVIPYAPISTICVRACVSWVPAGSCGAAAITGNSNPISNPAS